MRRNGLRKKTVAKLRELGNATFDIARIASVAAIYPEEANLLAIRMVTAGELVRVARGLYRLPDRPATLGVSLRWMANADSFHLSHRTAMAAYGFGPPLPHAELLVTVPASKRTQSLTHDIKLVYVRRALNEHGESKLVDVPGLGPVSVSTPETTLLAGLTTPELCGGVLELCRFVAQLHGQWDGAKLVEVGSKFGVAASVRRAAMLLDLAGDPARAQLTPLIPRVDVAVASLDAEGPRIGKLDRTWKIRMNLPREAVLEALHPHVSSSSAV